MSTRAKFSCTSVKKSPYGEEISLWALYSNNKEDNQFAAATPSGTMSMMVSNPAVFGFFQEGKQYYLDISPAE